jgi:branched-chain amino acid transport system ATP-binding protein
MEKLILDVANVTVQFGSFKAVNNVSMKVSNGDKIAILGPNGAGKTSLFNAITGMTLPGQGSISMGGVDITKSSPNRRAELGIARTFQITNLFFGLTIEENLLLAARGLLSRKFSLFSSSVLPQSEEQLVQSVLERCQLLSKRHWLVKEISYGEQRQLELAMSLTSSPKVLLLDEPAAGLSPAERVVMSDVIKSLPKDLAIVLIEHDIDLALNLVDKVICMYQGAVLVEGKPDEIRGNKQVQEIYLGKPRHA